jgi:hypothetical protein
MRPRVHELAKLINDGTDMIVQALRRAAAEGLDAGELTDLLKVAFADRNRVEFATLGAIGALARAADEDPDGRQTGGLDCTAWLAHQLDINSSQANAQVRLAQRLPALPATSAALERGELSGSHAGVVSRIAEMVERGGGEARAAETLMLQEVHGRDPRELLRYGLGLVHRLAPREMVAEERERHRRRYLRLAELFDGGYAIEGYLDPVGGATLKTALHGLLGRRGNDDKRTPGQRRADGLVELATRVLDSGTLPVRGGERPHLTITATLEALRGDAGGPAALLESGFPISAEQLRSIAPDATITPVPMGPDGEPLPAARRQRTAARKMVRALGERYGRCTWPGCDRPAGQCEGHHEEAPHGGARRDVDQTAHFWETGSRQSSEDRRPERRPDDATLIDPLPARRQPPQPPPAGWLAADARGDDDDDGDDDDGGGDQGDGDRDDGARPYLLRR